MTDTKRPKTEKEFRSVAAEALQFRKPNEVAQSQFVDDVFKPSSKQLETVRQQTQDLHDYAIRNK